LTDFLKGKKYFVEEAVDGWDALHKLDCNTFDIIITDIRMPGMNGLDLISELKSLKLEIKIICMSGNSSGRYLAISKEQIKELDSDAFLVKTFDLGELHTLLKRLLEPAC